MSGLVWTVLLAGLSACRRSPSPPATEPAEARVGVEPAADARGRPLPTYRFAPGLEERYPQVTAFVRQFLETCLANDYEGYRRLVSRFADPVTQKRFEAIYRAIRSVVVESVRPLDIRRLPFAASDVEPPFYLVVSTVNLDPQQHVSLRGEKRPIAILVFREHGAWRMAAAPSHLQPRSGASQPASAPVTSQPDYPWDLFGDD